MPGYTIPELIFPIGGVEYTFRADIHLHAWLTEALISEPWRFDLDEVGGRLLYNRDNMVGLFAAAGRYHHPDVDWATIIDNSNPVEVMAVMRGMDTMMLLAGVTKGHEETDSKKATD